MIDRSFTEVFASALHGSPTVVVGLGDEPMALPVDLWTRTADDHDRALVALCDGPTLDIGCGPGRMTEALGDAGHLALGIDVVDAAVSLTRRRGASALCRDVFERVPGEGRWHTALLADGNIGIGGDPVALLERVRELLAPDGRVVLDLAPWGSGISTRHVSLATPSGRSGEFPWTLVGADAIQAVASAAGLGEVAHHQRDHRWMAVVGARP